MMDNELFEHLKVLAKRHNLPLIEVLARLTLKEKLKLIKNKESDKNV